MQQSVKSLCNLQKAHTRTVATKVHYHFIIGFAKSLVYVFASTGLCVLFDLESKLFCVGGDWQPVSRCTAQKQKRQCHANFCELFRRCEFMCIMNGPDLTSVSNNYDALC
jgi:hypothetical protein